MEKKKNEDVGDIVMSMLYEFTLNNVMTFPAATFQTGHQLVNTGLLS